MPFYALQDPWPRDAASRVSGVAESLILPSASPLLLRATPRQSRSKFWTGTGIIAHFCRSPAIFRTGTDGWETVGVTMGQMEGRMSTKKLTERAS